MSLFSPISQTGRPLGIAAIAATLLIGCGRPPEPADPEIPVPKATEDASAGSEMPPMVYRVRGTVRKVTDGGAMAVIDHEEIPDYMEAMSMPFYPKDPAVFADLEPGQNIEFDLHVDGDKSWVENVSELPKSAVQIATEEQ